jgi:hypothetical protein
MSVKKKRRFEILHAGMKMLTPYERGIVEKATELDKARWEWLFHPDRNRWKPPSTQPNLRLENDEKA